MIAVTDTSPVCYLVLIAEIDLLPKLFSQVFMPAAVLAELVHADGPGAVRNWAINLPSWVTVKDCPVRSATGMEKLHLGEQEAILLAETTAADIILLDEKSARRVATARGLRIAGTLGLLADAADRGMIDLAAAIERLSNTNFRCSPALLKAMLDRFGVH